MREQSLPEEGVAGLVRKVRDGDEEAFERLSELYRNLTENAVRRFLPSFEGAGAGSISAPEDLGQIAALALYRAALTYDPEAKGGAVTFGLYAKVCVNNALISELRRAKAAQARREKSERRVGRTAARENDPLALLVEAEDSAALRRRIRETLAPLEKDVFELYCKGMSVGRIAELLRKDRKSVSNALYRVKAKIKGLLQNPL